VSREGEWLLPEEAGLRLILLLPDAIAAEALAEALPIASPAAVVAAPPDLGRLRTRCAAAGCALLARDDVAAALAAGADGAQIAGAAGAREARLRLGERRLLGVEVGASRHAAMLAGEAGADFVTFRAADQSGRIQLDRLSALVAWWSGLSVLPCAAIGEITADAVPALAAAGADFLAVEPSVWQHPRGAAEILGEIAAAIARPPRGARRAS
jgi:thiamine-phosphate pyrophosphorylase